MLACLLACLLACSLARLLASSACSACSASPREGYLAFAPSPQVYLYMCISIHVYIYTRVIYIYMYVYIHNAMISSSCAPRLALPQGGPPLSSSYLDLLRRLMSREPEVRPSAQAILQSAWLAE